MSAKSGLHRAKKRIGGIRARIRCLPGPTEKKFIKGDYNYRVYREVWRFDKSKNRDAFKYYKKGCETMAVQS